MCNKADNCTWVNFIFGLSNPQHVVSRNALSVVWLYFTSPLAWKQAICLCITMLWQFSEEYDNHVLQELVGELKFSSEYVTYELES
jgi:hypothetical protein